PKSGDALSPAQPEIRDHQKSYARHGIERDIPNRALARRNEALVPFIHRGDEGGPQPGQQRRAQQQGINSTERSPPTTQQQQAQHAVSDDVSGLAQIVMKDEEVVEIDLAEQTRQYRIQYAAGILRREGVGGLKRNEADPDGRWPPGTHKIGTRRSQIGLVPHSAA